ncbi:nSTAND1 domain-containing NTPase [Nonomuraea sp. NPDC003707]
MIQASLRRLKGSPPAGEDLEAVVERQIREVLAAGGEQAEQLRAEIAALLRPTGVVGAAIQAALDTGDRELQAQLAAGLAELGEQFDEFDFVLTDLHVQLELIRESVDRASAGLQVSMDLQYRQAIDIRLLLEQVSVVVRRTRASLALGDGVDASRWEDCPYKGLMAFGEADAAVFHGRDLAIARLVSTLGRHVTGSGPLVVTGASGAGKSSLLRAGLLPAVGRGELTEEARHWWRHVLPRPTGSPLSPLALLLAAMAGLDVPTVLDRLRARPGEAHLLVRQAVEADARRRGLSEAEVATCRLLLVVDQFEEIFTPVEGQEAADAAAERSAFVAALHAASTRPCGELGTPAALVVIAVRGDFIDRCAGQPLMEEALARPFIVGPMSESELRRAISGPADAAGLEIESGLVETILSDLRGLDGEYGAGTLPLLSQTMLTTWEHREENRLTSRGYGRTGGVEHAVAASADAAYDGLDPADRIAARQMFRQLTAVSQEGRLSRRPMARPAVAATGGTSDVGRAMEAFARRRLIVVDDETVQIAHDVLLVVWPQLRGWLEADLTGHALYSQFLDDAEEWRRNGRQADYLYRGERLTSLLQHLPRWQSDHDRHPALLGAAHEFVVASTAARTRAARRNRLLLTVLTTLLVVAMVAAGAAIRARQDVAGQRDMALSRVVAVRAESIVDDPALSALLAAAAWQISPTDEARAALLARLHTPLRAVLPNPESGVWSVAFSPDGRILAAASTPDALGNEGRGKVQLWDVATRRQIGTLADPDGEVYSVAFSPDGRVLATTSSGASITRGSRSKTELNSVVRLWDVATRRQIGTLADPDGDVYSVAFSPDGRTLASTSIGPGTGDGRGEGKVRLWDLATRRQIGAPLIDPDGEVTSVAFSPDGRLLASGGGYISERNKKVWGRVLLWNVATHRRSGAPLREPNGEVTSVAFSPDGRTLASGSAPDIIRDGTGKIRLWDVSTHRQIADPLAEPDGGVSSVAFSRDGRTLASASASDFRPSGSKVRLWDTTTHAPIGAPFTDPEGGVYSVAFSPDGRTLANTSINAGADGSSDKGRVRLWDVAIHAQVGALPDPDGGVYTVAFSPDGRTLAGVGASTEGKLGTRTHRGWVRLWDTGTGRQIGAPLTDPASVLYAVAFSPDGCTLATVGTDGAGTRGSKVVMWDVPSRRPIGAPLADPDHELGPMAFSPDGRLLATGDGRKVRLWDTRTREQIAALLAPGVQSVAFSPDGRLLATGGIGVRLWDAATRTQIGAPLTDSGEEETMSVAFSPDGRILAGGSSGGGISNGGKGNRGRVRLWDVTTRTQIGAPLFYPDGGVHSVAFSPDGRTLASANFDHETAPTGSSLRIWDVATRKQIGAPLTDPDGRVESVAFSPDGRTLASAHANHFNFYGADRGEVRLWDTALPHDLQVAACSIAGRPLTRAEWRQHVSAIGFQDVCP